MDDHTLLELSQQTGLALRRRGWSLATAESCTGGWVAKCLTDVPGSSDYLERGFVSYSTAAKSQQLGVPTEVLDEHGAVSEAVVMAMASGARVRSGAQCAVAVSGVAGPGGGTPEKPVGLVWFAWATPDGVAVESEHFTGDRAAVRRAATGTALQGILRVLQ